MSNWKSISIIAEEVRTGKVTATEMVNQALENIEQGTEYDAILSLTDTRAKQRAKTIDQQIARGEDAGRLAGVPFIAKDNFLTFGGKTTAASKILENFEAPYQATAIEKLESEGAICVAKSNLDAFGHGSGTENSDFMVTKNPHDKTRVPGGSSGGSAAAVALRMAPFALGTDTGGSIRFPASFSGVVGFKPTYGLVSRSGVIAMISSTDVIGPITQSTEDAAVVLDVLAGKDELDGTTIDRDSVPYTEPTGSLKGAKIGVIKEYFDEGVDPAVKKTVQSAIDNLKNAGAKVQEISLPSLPLALACYYVICPAEVSSNLSRYDGQRYGFSDKKAKNLQQSYELSRSSGFGSEAKRRIMIGTYVLSSGYYDAYYKKAQVVRTKLINEFNEAFSKVDFLIGPTAPTIAYKLGSHSNPLDQYLTDIMTVSASLTGVPAISLPVGTAHNMPVGMQIMANQKNDRALLSIANQIERILK